MFDKSKNALYHLTDDICRPLPLWAAALCVAVMTLVMTYRATAPADEASNAPAACIDEP